MSLLRNHLALMIIYAAATAAFFSLLWRHGRRERIRFFLIVFLSLFIGAVILSWTMYPFPSR